MGLREGKVPMIPILLLVLLATEAQVPPTLRPGEALEGVIDESDPVVETPVWISWGAFILDGSWR